MFSREQMVERGAALGVITRANAAGPTGMTSWRAGSSGTGTSGSAGGLGRRIGRMADTAPQADPTKNA